MKTTETGISLSPEQKRLIDDYINKNWSGTNDQIDYLRRQFTQLVEQCIYADREVINQNNE